MIRGAPIEPLPDPRAEVRVRPTAPVSLDAGSQTVYQVDWVEGEVYKCTGDTRGLFSRWPLTSYRYRQPMVGAVFFFDRSQLARLEVRRFAPLKTATAVAAVTGGVVAVSEWAIRLGGGSESSGLDGGAGGGLNVRVPIPLGILTPR